MARLWQRRPQALEEAVELHVVLRLLAPQREDVLGALLPLRQRGAELLTKAVGLRTVLDRLPVKGGNTAL